MIPRIVNGATQLLGIVGDPIRQVRAPEVWSALFRRNSVNALCIPMQVTAADLRPFLASMRTVLNLKGMIVTIPHKPAAREIANEVTKRAGEVGTVNVLRPRPEGGWFGDIVDGVGFVKALLSAGQRIKGRRAIVVGSGGVGSAIAFAVAEAGAECVAVSDIAADRATALARRVQAASGVKSFVSAARADGFDLVANASPLGMRDGDPLPLDCTGLSASAIAADVVVQPEITPFLAIARGVGCHVQPGTRMMDHQVATMAEFFDWGPGDWSSEAIERAMT